MSPAYKAARALWDAETPQKPRKGSAAFQRLVKAVNALRWDLTRPGGPAPRYYPYRSLAIAHLLNRTTPSAHPAGALKGVLPTVDRIRRLPRGSLERRHLAIMLRVAREVVRGGA